MPTNLKRYQQSGDLHFITFSCHQREAFLNSTSNRNIFEQALESIRSRYRFGVIGYVIMPEHIHLLVTEPEQTPLATALMALKISSSKRLDPSPFWQPRYYDFNIYTANKRVEKLRYIHETLFDAGW